MNKTTLSSIHPFAKDKNIAFVGLSRNEKHFSQTLYKGMIENGYKIYPVNPNYESNDGNSIYKKINDVPENINNAILMTPKSETRKVVDECIAKGIKNIWIQQGAQTKEIKNEKFPKDVNVVTNECFFMYMDPVKGPHAFHRFLKKLFGNYPK